MGEEEFHATRSAETIANCTYSYGANPTSKGNVTALFILLFGCMTHPAARDHHFEHLDTLRQFCVERALMRVSLIGSTGRAIRRAT